jgi:hypothetical protein
MKPIDRKDRNQEGVLPSSTNSLPAEHLELLDDEARAFVIATEGVDEIMREASRFKDQFLNIHANIYAFWEVSGGRLRENQLDTMRTFLLLQPDAFAKKVMKVEAPETKPETKEAVRGEEKATPPKAA